MKSYLTRGQARQHRDLVNAKAPAKLKAPVKNGNGMWESAGISHGSKMVCPVLLKRK